MPQKKEKTNVDPSPSFMRRMMGSPVTEATEKDWPELANEWASAEVNMPKETSMVNRVGPMGPVERFLTGNATGRSNLGNISINRQNVTEDNNLRDTLVHELTHVGQPSRGLVQYMKDIFTPYEERPVEKEALTAEQNYKWKKANRDRVLR